MRMTELRHFEPLLIDYSRNRARRAGIAVAGTEPLTPVFTLTYEAN
jgi:hypothetical protein